MAGGGGGRENGWVHKILWVEMGGLNRNSPSQGVGKVKIIKSENIKIFALFVLLRSNKYHLLYISICKVFHFNLPNSHDKVTEFILVGFFVLSKLK
jgi:hypothetical protein